MESPLDLSAALDTLKVSSQPSRAFDIYLMNIYFAVFPRRDLQKQIKWIYNRAIVSKSDAMQSQSNAM